MAQAVRIRTLISSATLSIPGLDRFIGKRVEVIVIEDDDGEAVVTSPARRSGSLAGKLVVADDFDAPIVWARS